MKRKGFTLVELLIVIVVIGILSAMMMLSSTEAVTSAKASNIVSNLRNFKTAAMALYVDYLDKMDAGNVPTATTDTAWTPDTKVADTDKLLIKYMNKGDSDATDGETDKYHLVTGTIKDSEGRTANAYFVQYTGATDSRIQEKLKGRAASVGLLEGTGTTAKTVYKTAGTSTVYMLVTQYGSTAAASN